MSFGQLYYRFNWIDDPHVANPADWDLIYAFDDEGGSTPWTREDQ